MKRLMRTAMAEKLSGHRLLLFCQHTLRLPRRFITYAGTDAIDDMPNAPAAVSWQGCLDAPWCLRW
jgi:hypothetical protein